MNTRTVSAEYLWERRSALLDKAVAIRDAFWTMKLMQEDDRRRSNPGGQMNRLGVRVRVQRGWITCNWMRMEYSVSRVGGQSIKKNFWRHISGKNPNTQRYSTSVLGPDPRQAKLLFKEAEGEFVPIRQEQESLKSVYKALKKYASEHDEDLALDLREYIAWKGDDRLKYDPDFN